MVCVWGMPYKLLVLEMAVDITTALELSDRLAPSCRVWIPICDVRWSRPSWKEPDINLRTCPFCRVDTAANRIKIGAVRLRVLILDVTSSIARLSWGVDVAVRGGERAGESTAIVDGTAVGCV